MSTTAKRRLNFGSPESLLFYQGKKESTHQVMLFFEYELEMQFFLRYYFEKTDKFLKRTCVACRTPKTALKSTSDMCKTELLLTTSFCLYLLRSRSCR